METSLDKNGRFLFTVLQFTSQVLLQTDAQFMSCRLREEHCSMQLAAQEDLQRSIGAKTLTV